MAIDLKALVAAGIFPDTATAIEEALRVLWQERPAIRLEVAVYRYRTEPELSLAQAAALARVSFDRMKVVLAEHGVVVRLGPEKLEDARAEHAALRQMPK